MAWWSRRESRRSLSSACPSPDEIERDVDARILYVLVALRDFVLDNAVPQRAQYGRILCPR